MHMIAVRDIALVRHARHNAESLLQAFCEFISRTLDWRSVNTESDVRLLFPLLTRIIHMLHNIQCKRRCFRISMGFACHVFHTFVQSCITERYCGISAVEQFVDRLALLQPCKSSELPEDRRRIGERAFQSVVPAHESAVAQIQSVIKNLPEFIHISSGRKCYVHKVDRHNSLVETPVEFILTILIFPRTQGTPASHYRKTVSLFELFHLLLGNVIRYKSLCRTLCGKFCQIVIRGSFLHIIFFQHIDKLRERRSHPDSRLVLHALVTLLERLFDDHGKIFLLRLALCFI